MLNKIAFNFYTTNIDKTFEYAKEAGELADNLNFAKGKAESLRITGIYYYFKADYPLALEDWRNDEYKQTDDILIIGLTFIPADSTSFFLVIHY